MQRAPAAVDMLLALTPQELAVVVEGLMELPAKKSLRLIERIGLEQAALIQAAKDKAAQPPGGDKP